MNPQTGSRSDSSVPDKRGAIQALDTILIVAIALGLLVQLAMLSRMDLDIAIVFVRAWLLATLMCAIPVSILWFLDRRDRESRWLLAAAFLWGGLVSTTLSMPLNTAAFHLVDQWIAGNPVIGELLGPEATTMIAAPLSAPVVEELAKWAGLLLIFRMARDEFHGVRDGFIYGALIGVGFNWFEAPLYVMQGYAEHGVAPFHRELGLRHGVLGLGGHALFTGIAGLFLGLAAQTQRRWVRWTAPAIGVLIAVLAHLINNVIPLLGALSVASQDAPQQQQFNVDQPGDLRLIQWMVLGSIPQLTILLPLTLIVVLAVWRSGIRERRIVREELASEIGRSVTSVEYQGVVADRMLRTRRIDGLPGYASRMLVNLQNRLAFRKHRVRQRGSDPEQDPVVADLRHTIVQVRDAAASLAKAGPE